MLGHYAGLFNAEERWRRLSGNGEGLVVFLALSPPVESPRSSSAGGTGRLGTDPAEMFDIHPTGML